MTIQGGWLEYNVTGKVAVRRFGSILLETVFLFWPTASTKM